MFWFDFRHFALMESSMSTSGSDLESQEPHEERELSCKGRRRKREFIPEEMKDDLYWEKRRKNNEAAKRSREKRKMNDHVLENHLEALKEENARLSAELMAIKVQFGLVYPVAYSQPNHRQHYAHSSAPTNTHHHRLFHRDHYWRDSSFVPNYPQSLFVPTYALNSYVNGPSATRYGLLNPLVLPQHLMAGHLPAAPLLKPVPTRATAEEDEQRVPGLFSLPISALAGPVNPRGGKKCSPYDELN